MVKGTFDVQEDSGGDVAKLSLSLHMVQEEKGSINSRLLDSATNLGGMQEVSDFCQSSKPLGH